VTFFLLEAKDRQKKTGLPPPKGGADLLFFAISAPSALPKWYLNVHRLYTAFLLCASVICLDSENAFTPACFEL